MKKRKKNTKETPLFLKKFKFHKLTLKQKISKLFSCGFNAQEIADKLGVHRVTVQRYRKTMKDEFDNDTI